MANLRSTSKDVKLKVALDRINNLEPKLYETLYLEMVGDPLLPNSSDNMLSYIRKRLGIFKSINRAAVEYWSLRGWSELECVINSNKFRKETLAGRLSPFDYKYWLEKGLSKEDAAYKANSFRPIRKEYWMEQGYSEQDAIVKAAETKQNNNKKGSQASKDIPYEIRKSYSHRCKEYWMIQGYSEQEAIEKVQEIQSTFTLDKCIAKHGEDEGHRIWKTRQENWQNTLDSKSEEEKCIINIKKARNVRRVKVGSKLYIMELFTDEGAFIKLGVSRNIENRISQLLSSCLDLNVIGLYVFKDSYGIEQYLLNKYSTPDILPKNKFGGYTECLPISYLEIIQNELSELLLNENAMHD